MEKTRFCCRRLFTSCTLGIFFSFSLMAESKEVSVDVPIVDGNVAAALNSAKNEAFRKAVESSLKGDLSDVQKSERIKNAITYVKSFELVSQKEEGGRLFASYLVELNIDEAQGQTSTGLEADVFAVEWTWKSEVQRPSLDSLRKQLSEKFGLRVGLIRLNRGTYWFELSGRSSPQAAYRDLSREFSRQAELKLHLDPYQILGTENELDFPLSQPE